MNILRPSEQNRLAAALNALLRLEGRGGMHTFLAASGVVVSAKPIELAGLELGNGCPVTIDLTDLLAITVTAPDDTYDGSFQNEHTVTETFVNPAPVHCDYNLTLTIHGQIRRYNGANGDGNTGDRIKLFAIDSLFNVNLNWQSHIEIPLPLPDTNLPADPTMEEFTATVGPFSFPGGSTLSVIHSYFDKFNRTDSYVEVTAATIEPA